MKKNKKVFITGACGFFGSHLTNYLYHKGFQVRAMSYYNSYGSSGWLDTLDNEVIRGIDIVQGDIRDKEFLENNILNHDIVVHLAALIGIPYSYRAIDSYIQTNVTGTFNVIEASKKNNVEKIICTSTSEVYGSAQYIPIDESHPYVPQSPYSASKIAADQIALSYYYSFNLPITVLRPFNLFGPRQSLRAVIPSIILQSINSEVINIGATNTFRDFNFVEDTCEAYYKCIISKKKILKGNTINIGSGEKFSIKDIIKKVSKILNKKVSINYEKIRERPKNSEVNILLSSTKKSQEILNWSPKKSGKNIDIGLSETINWDQKMHYLFHILDWCFVHKLPIILSLKTLMLV